MIHLRISRNSVLCKARGDLRTVDIWRVNCQDCLDLLDAYLYQLELQKRREREGDGS